MPRRNQPEAAIQKAVVQHLRARAVPGLCWFHVPNGGKRNPREAAIFKALGVKAGVPDLLLFHNHRFFALELKSTRGRMSPAQTDFMAQWRVAGGYFAQVNSLDMALRVLEGLGLLKPAVTMRSICEGLGAAE